MSPQIWPVQYLHFRILIFPLINGTSHKSASFVRRISQIGNVSAESWIARIIMHKNCPISLAYNRQLAIPAIIDPWNSHSISLLVPATYCSQSQNPILSHVLRGHVWWLKGADERQMEYDSWCFCRLPHWLPWILGSFTLVLWQSPWCPSILKSILGG